jgi:hypothetical protein
MNIEVLDTVLQKLKEVNTYVHGGCISRVLSSQIWAWLFFKLGLIEAAEIRALNNFSQRDESIVREAARASELEQIMNWCALVCPKSYMPDVDELLDRFEEQTYQHSEDDTVEMVACLMEEFENELTEAEVRAMYEERTAIAKTAFDNNRDAFAEELKILLQGQCLYLTDAEIEVVAAEGGIPVDEVNRVREFNPTDRQCLKILESMHKSVDNRIDRNRQNIMKHAFQKESVAENKMLRPLRDQVTAEASKLSSLIEAGTETGIEPGSTEDERVAFRDAEADEKSWKERLFG